MLFCFVLFFNSELHQEFMAPIAMLFPGFWIVDTTRLCQCSSEAAGFLVTLCVGANTHKVQIASLGAEIAVPIFISQLVIGCTAVTNSQQFQWLATTSCIFYSYVHQVKPDAHVFSLSAKGADPVWNTLSLWQKERTAEPYDGFSSSARVWHFHSHYTSQSKSWSKPDITWVRCCKPHAIRLACIILWWRRQEIIRSHDNTMYHIYWNAYACFFVNYISLFHLYIPIRAYIALFLKYMWE